MPMPTARHLNLKVVHCKFIKREQAKLIYAAGAKIDDDSSFGCILSKGNDSDFLPSRMPLPTGARPGSIEKIELYAARLLRGEELNHPGDERVSGTIDMQNAMIEFAMVGRKERKAKSIKAKKKRKRLSA